MAKLNEELLNEVKQVTGTMQYVQSKIGEIAIEQSRAVKAFEQLSEQLEVLKTKIREEHGDVEVDLETGEIKEVKKG
jgi:predicted nuclease with TOPRIM domain